MELYGDQAFKLIELGHHIDVVMNYEITALLGYAIKKADRIQEVDPNRQSDSTDSGWQTQGNKRKKVMTSDQLAQKARKGR